MERRRRRRRRGGRKSKCENREKGPETTPDWPLNTPTLLNYTPEAQMDSEQLSKTFTRLLWWWYITLDTKREREGTLLVLSQAIEFICIRFFFFFSPFLERFPLYIFSCNSYSHQLRNSKSVIFKIVYIEYDVRMTYEAVFWSSPSSTSWSTGTKRQE